MDYIRGKRFLITQNALANIVGGEIAVLELAKYLQSAGAEVTVYTWFFGREMARHFKKAKINVVQEGGGGNDSVFLLENFDFIWVHNQVLPPSMIRQLSSPIKRMPRFLFQHLSPLDTHPLDQPYIWDMERRLSSRSLFISEKTKEKLLQQFYGDSLTGRVDLYRNPVPNEFVASEIHEHVLKRVLVVSNHPPKELRTAMEYISKGGIGVDTLGAGSSKKQLVTPNLLKKYDLIITIGKTVQYALCMGIPVYVYDHYGGPGYLSKDNYHSSGLYNFSGRGQDPDTGEYITNKKAASIIAKEVIDGYSSALEFQKSHWGKFKSEFSIEGVVTDILSNTKERRVEPFEPIYVNYVVTVQYMVRMYTHDINATYRASIDKLEDRLGRELLELSNARSLIDSMRRNEVDFERGVRESMGILRAAIKRRVRFK